MSATHRENFLESYSFKPKSDCIYYFLINLEPNDVRLDPNQSENGKYILISVWINKIPKSFVCVNRNRFLVNLIRMCWQCSFWFFSVKQNLIILLKKGTIICTIIFRLISKENCQHDHILFVMKGSGIFFLWAQECATGREQRWKKLYSLSERLPVLDIMGAQLKVPLKPLNTIVLWRTGCFRESFNWTP